MNSLLNMLPIMLRLSGENEEVRREAVFAAWRAVAGSQISYNCVPLELDKKRLIIATLDLSWVTQMERVSGQFLFRINSLLDGPCVTFIEFRIDRKTVLDSRPADTRKVGGRHTDEIEAYLSGAAEEIKNQSLREIFLRAATKSLGRGE